MKLLVAPLEQLWYIICKGPHNNQRIGVFSFLFVESIISNAAVCFKPLYTFFILIDAIRKCFQFLLEIIWEVFLVCVFFDTRFFAVVFG